MRGGFVLALYTTGHDLIIGAAHPIRAEANIQPTCNARLPQGTLPSRLTFWQCSASHLPSPDSGSTHGHLDFSHFSLPQLGSTV